jgi:hypothetical protein
MAMQRPAPAARTTNERVLEIVQTHLVHSKIADNLEELWLREPIRTSTVKTGMTDPVSLDAEASLAHTVADRRPYAESPEQATSSKKKGSTSDKRKEQVRRSLPYALDRI